MIFVTTKKQINNLNIIMKKMGELNIDINFLMKLYFFASKDQGIYDLAHLWEESTNTIDKKEIMNTIESCIYDYEKFN